ncbi:GNAT family N-acetyltransferase [Terriglobus albidus]|nr:GNAT family N-acetyltransferase [Terriglobus albidus]
MIHTAGDKLDDMGISVRFYEDPRSFLAVAEEFLLSRAVLHNLVLTIVDTRLAQPEPGRYWVAFRDSQVVGLALQSPLTFPALLVPMEADVAAALVDTITEGGIMLPGVNGEVATAASFAGRWTERRRSGAVPMQAFRIYQLAGLNEIAPVGGQLRKGDYSDRNLAVSWLQKFYAETHMHSVDAENFIDTALAAERLWLWDIGGTVSMAVSSKPIAGVVRLSAVYTPKEHRGCGYAGACVHAVSSLLTNAGYCCILYTDLGNPTSNSIYRKIGYKAVGEAILYRFES